MPPSVKYLHGFIASSDICSYENKVFASGILTLNGDQAFIKSISIKSMSYSDLVKWSMFILLELYKKMNQYQLLLYCYERTSVSGMTTLYPAK